MGCSDAAWIFQAIGERQHPNARSIERELGVRQRVSCHASKQFARTRYYCHHDRRNSDQGHEKGLGSKSHLVAHRWRVSLSTAPRRIKGHHISATTVPALPRSVAPKIARPAMFRPRGEMRANCRGRLSFHPLVKSRWTYLGLSEARTDIEFSK